MTPDNSLIDNILDENGKKLMHNWDLPGFKREYPHLYQVITNTIVEYGNKMVKKEMGDSLDKELTICLKQNGSVESRLKNIPSNFELLGILRYFEKDLWLKMATGARQKAKGE